MTGNALRADAVRDRSIPAILSRAQRAHPPPTLGAAVRERIHAINLWRRQ